MKLEELQARLAILESFTLSALAIAMMAHGPDPGKKRGIATLDTIKIGARKRLRETSSDVKHGEAYLDELLSDFSENLGRLTGRGGQGK